MKIGLKKEQLQVLRSDPILKSPRERNFGFVEKKVKGFQYQFFLSKLFVDTKQMFQVVRGQYDNTATVAEIRVRLSAVSQHASVLSAVISVQTVNKPGHPLLCSFIWFGILSIYQIRKIMKTFKMSFIYTPSVPVQLS